MTMHEVSPSLAPSEAIAGKWWLILVRGLAAIAFGMVCFVWPALNQMFDIQTKRVAVGVSYRIPLLVWAVLYTLTILAALGVGYLFGMSGQPNWLLALVLAVALSIVITLIVDLDSSGAARPGFIEVSQQPMLDLQQWINEQMVQGQV